MASIIASAIKLPNPYLTKLIHGWTSLGCEKENHLPAPIRWTMQVIALGLLLSCMAVSVPSISGVTPSNDTTNNAPLPSSPHLPKQPTGLTVVNNLEPGTPVASFFDGKLFDDRTYSNPNIAGLTFRTSWADIEPTQGNFVWNKPDTVFNEAEKNNKWVELVLIPGFGRPAWALQGVQTSTFGVNYGPGKGDQFLLPLPWDQTYLNRWFTFLKAVSARYQNRSSFIKIAADGPTSITGEMTLLDTPADICTWVKLGYTSDRIIAAWKRVFTNYAQIFPRQYFSLALYPPLPIVSTTRCENGIPNGIDHTESQRVRDILIGLGADNYPKRFILQENGLTWSGGETTIGAYNIVKSYSGKVVIGYQLATSAMSNPIYMGDPDGATALQNSLQRGIDGHAQFLEVYEQDVLSPAAQNVLAAFSGKLASAAH